MKIAHHLALLSLIILCGCAHRSDTQMRSAHGDLGRFLAATVLEYGGRRPPGLTNDLPTIHCSWRYRPVKGDVQGMVIQMKTHRHFPDLAHWMSTAFGKAKTNPYVVGIGESGTSQYGVYSPSQIGVRIQFGHNGTNAFCEIFRYGR